MMENYKYLFSIIIPTKNRYSTLFPVLDFLIDNLNDGYNYEVIIQDNSENNSICLEYLTNRKEPKLKYFYNQASIPISENAELAIQNSNGKYLIFIGDDDFISPQICEIVEYLNNKNIDCLIHNPGYYWWDSVSFSKENFYHKPNNLWLPNEINFELIALNSDDELNKTLYKGAVSYYLLPRLYHGIIKRDIINKIKSETGNYIIGSCPDIALAISISLVLKNYYYVNYPVTIFGASRNSGGGMTARNQHFGELGKMSFLRPNITNVWDKNIPKVWSQTTIYPQTTTEVLKIFKNSGGPNFLAFYATMIVNEPYLFNFTFKSILRFCKLNPIKYFYLILLIIKKSIGKLFRNYKIRFKKLDYKVYEKVEVFDLIKLYPRFNE